MTPITSRKSMKGFTLLELLITVSILGVLTMIGASAYQDFTARAQTSEALRLVEGVKHTYEVAFAENGKQAPLTLVDLYGPGANPDDFTGEYVNNISMSAGHIVVFFDSDTGIGTLVMSPYENAAGAVIWQCGNAPAPKAADGIADLSPAGTGSGGTVAGARPINGATDDVLPRVCRS